MKGGVRIFGGKRYKYFWTSKTKREAQKVARRQRLQGFNARVVVGSYYGYDVFVIDRRA